MVCKFAGRIKFFESVWHSITNDSKIIQTVKGYKTPFVHKPQQFIVPAEPIFSKFETKACEKAINILLEKGAVSACSPKKQQFISTYFLREKSNGEYRFILNLKRLNEFIQPCHFKMENIKTALKLMTRNCYMSKIDLKDSYFLIPIHDKFKKYLRFVFQTKMYEFNALPFGLSTAPYVFTKLMKPIIEYLREKGFVSVIYLDDILMFSDSIKGCIENFENTRILIESLGLIINYDKSELSPSHQCKFLGFILDSQDYSLYLTKEKRDKIKNLLNILYNLNSSTIRCVAQTIGTLISACPAVEYSWLYTKRLEREKFLALINNNGDFDKYMEINKSMKTDMKWWLTHIDSAKCFIKDNDYCLEIYTDASLTGWGVFCNGEKAHGWWENSNSDHINVLELKAAFLGLRCFARDKRNCQILMRIDNTTAISYINKMGGIQYENLNNCARTIWQWCERRKIHIFASYISSKDNVYADLESRILPPETEWTLANSAFNLICKKFGTPKIDLFATYLNTKCKVFVSWKRDPKSFAIDAFTLSWKKFYFYAFPSFSVILNVLRKIVLDRAEGIVVVPYWPTQPWFPVYKSLAISPIILFDADDYLLTSPYSQKHPLARKLSLAAAVLSANRLNERDFPKKRQK